ncbi:MAG: hypothetical protein WBQ95_07070 [Terracidiphilus sp.]
MQVFTTIFVAETQRANIRRVDMANDPDREENGLSELKQALRKRIAMLESRGWFEGDGFYEE